MQAARLSTLVVLACALVGCGPAPGSLRPVGTSWEFAAARRVARGLQLEDSLVSVTVERELPFLGSGVAPAAATDSVTVVRFYMRWPASQKLGYPQGKLNEDRLARTAWAEVPAALHVDYLRFDLYWPTEVDAVQYAADSLDRRYPRSK